MRYSKFVHYVQNYRHRTDVVVCWLPKFHGLNLAPLFHYIKGRGKFCLCVRFRCSSGLPGIAAGSSAGTVFTKMSQIQSTYPPYFFTAVLGYSTLPWRQFYQTRANGCIETKFHHNKCTQHVVSLHGGHVVPSALRSSAATVKVIVVWNSWSRRYPPQMREDLLPVRIIRRQKANTSEDTCTNHPVCCIVGGALGLEQVGSLL